MSIFSLSSIIPYVERVRSSKQKSLLGRVQRDSPVCGDLRKKAVLFSGLAIQKGGGNYDLIK